MQTREERQRAMTECLSDHIEQMFHDRARETMEYFHLNRESVLQSFLSAITVASGAIRPLIDLGKKQKIKFLQFSFLFSGALMNERRLKIDFYDAGYYGDLAEAGGFWDYSMLFPYVDDDIEMLRNKLTGQMRRVMEYELIDLRMVYHVGVFAIMEEILTLISADEAFANALTEIYEPKVLVIYGAYLSQSKLITTVTAR
ncbi:MAG: hypothetical protein LBH28_08510 [Oscillospiraceae bacterium]|jgi:hypothetical protein|nr:hypothetical protein [Oscillospiraceae bacterium]